MTDVVLYARLSVSREESVSIERQIEAGRKYAEARGWKVVGEFTDDGISASKIKPEARTGWRALLSFVVEHKVSAVVVWKVDRLARRVLDFLNADNALRNYGAGLVAVADPVDMTSAQGRAFATMLAVFAELEAESIAARVRDARRKLIADGRRTGGRPPYGWVNVDNPEGKGKVLAQDPARIGFVSELAARAMRGESVYALARWLDESGAPKRPHKGRKNDSWAEASVEAILRNPVLCGMTAYEPNRKPGTAPDPWAVVRDEDGVPVVDEEVAVLSTDQRRRLLSVLDAAKRPGSRAQSGRSPALLSKLLRCGTCRKTMHRSTSGGGYDGFRCTNRSCARQAAVNRARAEEWIAAEVLAERGETREMEFREYRPDNEALGLIEQGLREAGAELAATDDPDEVERILGRMASLKQRRAEAREVKPLTKRMVTPVRGGQSWGEEFSTALDSGDVVEAARLLREQVEYVEVSPAGQSARMPMRERARIEFTPLAEDVA